MELDDFTFSPVDQGWDWITVGFGGIAVLGLLVLFYQIKNKKQLSKSEISSTPIILMVGLATILAIGSLTYSFISTDQMETIKLSKTTIRTPFGVTNLDDIKKVYIYPDQNISSTDKNSKKEFFLIIEEYNGTQHSLSSQVYDVKQIYKKLLKAIER